MDAQTDPGFRCLHTCMLQRHIFTWHSSNYSFLTANVIWAAPSKNLFLGTRKQRRPRSACTSVQSDQGLHCLLKESLDTTECIKRQQRLDWYLVHVQDDLNFCTCSMMMMVWCFTSRPTLFKSYQDNGRMIMKGSVPWNTVQSWAEFLL